MHLEYRKFKCKGISKAALARRKQSSDWPSGWWATETTRKRWAEKVNQHKVEGKSMPHKADRCFSCKQPYENHQSPIIKVYGAKPPCATFEFVAYSSRSDRDILFSAPFQSASSAKVHTAIAWKQGDYSCNCTGFRNHRKCDHVKQMSTNPNAFKTKALQVHTGSGAGIVGEVNILQSEIEELEKAVSDGRDADISMLAAKIELKKMQLEAAGIGLAARFEKMQSNIRETMKRDLGITTPVEIKSKHTIETVMDADDPFKDL